MAKAGNFDGFFAMKARSFCGGIWCFWQQSYVDVGVLAANDQMVSLAITSGGKVN